MEEDLKMEERFDERFNDTFWAEIVTEAQYGDVDHKPFLKFIQSELELRDKQLREELMKMKENRHEKMNAVASAGGRRTIDEILELIEKK